MAYSVLALFFQWVFIDLILAGFFFVFCFVVMVPFAAILHLAMKPWVYFENGLITIVPNGGGSRLRLKRRSDQYQLSLLADGQLELRSGHWIRNLIPGGPIPPRMILLPRDSDRAEWTRMANSEMSKPL